LDTTGVWQQISAVSATGSDVTFTFSEPNVPFAGVLGATEIVPEHLWSTVPDPSTFANTTPIGTGPFVLDEFAPTQYKLKKNTTYWQADKVVPDEVLFPAQASDQSTNQLDVVSGKFDWAYNFLPDVDKTFVSKDSAHNIYWFPPGGAIGLYLNLTKAPYDNVDFRQGVSLSLDRTTIATKAVNGYLDQASQSGLILPKLADLRAGEERRRADLHGDVRDATAVGHHFGGDRSGQALHTLGDRCRIDDVGGERLLLATPAGDVRLVDDGRVVTTETQDSQVWPDRRAEAASELVVIGACEILDRGDAELGESRRRARADPPDLGDRFGAHRRDPLATSQPRNATRFGEAGRCLGQQTRVADADCT
jgi:hypothetical protein